MELLGTISEDFNEYRATHKRLLASRTFLYDGVKPLSTMTLMTKYEVTL